VGDFKGVWTGPFGSEQDHLSPSMRIVTLVDNCKAMKIRHCRLKDRG